MRSLLIFVVAPLVLAENALYPRWAANGTSTSSSSSLSKSISKGPCKPTRPVTKPPCSTSSTSASYPPSSAPYSSSSAPSSSSSALSSSSSAVSSSSITSYSAWVGHSHTGNYSYTASIPATPVTVTCTTPTTLSYCPEATSCSGKFTQP